MDFVFNIINLLLFPFIGMFMLYISIRILIKIKKNRTYSEAIKKWNSAIQKFNEAKRLDSSLTNDCNYNICSCYINIGLEYTNDDDSIVNQLNSLRYSPNSDRYLQLENMRNENLRNSLKFMLIAYDYDKKRKSLVEMISQIYGILGNKIKEKEFDTISQVLK